MTGAILQLVSNNSVQNTWINKNPEITFFKKVYRRHTLFAREFIDIPINNPNFGTTMSVIFPKKGDLIHRVFLSIKLPRLQAKFLSTKTNDIKHEILIDYPDQILTKKISDYVYSNNYINPVHILSIFSDTLNKYNELKNQFTQFTNLIKLITITPIINQIDLNVFNIENDSPKIKKYEYTQFPNDMTNQFKNHVYDLWLSHDSHTYPIYQTLKSIYIYGLSGNVNPMIINANKLSQFILNDNLFKNILNSPEIVNNYQNKDSLFDVNHDEIVNVYTILKNIYASLASTVPIILARAFIQDNPNYDLYISNVTKLNGSNFHTIYDPNYAQLFFDNIMDGISLSTISKSYLSLVIENMNIFFNNITSIFNYLISIYQDTLFESSSSLFYNNDDMPSNIYSYYLPTRPYSENSNTRSKCVFNLNIWYFYFFKYLDKIDPLIFVKYISDNNPGEFSTNGIILLKTMLQHVKINIEYYMMEISYLLNDLYRSSPSSNIKDSLKNYSPESRTDNINNHFIITMIYHRSHYPSIPEIFEYISYYIQNIEIETINKVMSTNIPNIPNTDLTKIKSVVDDLYQYIFRYFVDHYHSINIGQYTKSIIGDPKDKLQLSILDFVSHFLGKKSINNLDDQININNVINQMEFYFISEQLNISNQNKFYSQILSNEKYLKSNLSDVISQIILDSSDYFVSDFNNNPYYTTNNILRYAGKPYLYTPYESRFFGQVSINDEMLVPPNMDPPTDPYGVKSDYYRHVYDNLNISVEWENHDIVETYYDTEISDNMIDYYNILHKIFYIPSFNFVTYDKNLYQLLKIYHVSKNIYNKIENTKNTINIIKNNIQQLQNLIKDENANLQESIFDDVNETNMSQILLKIMDITTTIIDTLPIINVSDVIKINNMEPPKNIIEYINWKKIRYITQYIFYATRNKYITAINNFQYTNPIHIRQKNIIFDLANLLDYPITSNDQLIQPNANNFLQYIINLFNHYVTPSDIISQVTKITSIIVKLYEMLYENNLDNIVYRIFGIYSNYFAKKKLIVTKIKQLFSENAEFFSNNIRDILHDILSDDHQVLLRLPIFMDNIIKPYFQTNTEIADSVYHNINELLLGDSSNVKNNIIHEIEILLDPKIASLLNSFIYQIPEEHFDILYYVLGFAISNQILPNFFDFVSENYINPVFTNETYINYDDVIDKWISYLFDIRISNNKQLFSISNILTEISFYDFNNIQSDLEKYAKIMHDLNYYINKIVVKIEENMIIIDNMESVVSLIRNNVYDILARNKNANIAWIHKLGHYIVKNITLTRNGKTLDIITSEILDSNYELNEEKLDYLKMIGDVSDLTNFNNKVKDMMEITIPIKFYFNNHVSHSLPLITDITANYGLTIKLRDINDVIYKDRNSEFVNIFGENNVPNIISMKLIAEYIFLSKEERAIFTSKNLEYLVDESQYQSDIYPTNKNKSMVIKKYIRKSYIDKFGISRSSEIETIGNAKKINIRYLFSNPIKSLIVIFRSLDHINVSNRSSESYFPGEKQWGNYGIHPWNNLENYRSILKKRYHLILEKINDSFDEDLGLIRILNRILVENNQPTIFTQAVQEIKEFFMYNPFPYPIDIGYARVLETIYLLDVELPIFSASVVMKLLEMIMNRLGKIIINIIITPMTKNELYNFVLKLYQNKIDRLLLNLSNINDTYDYICSIYKQWLIFSICNDMVRYQIIDDRKNITDMISEYLDYLDLVELDMTDVFEFARIIFDKLKYDNNWKNNRIKNMHQKMIIYKSSGLMLPNISIDNIVPITIINKLAELIGEYQMRFFDSYYMNDINPVEYITPNTFSSPLVFGHIKMNNIPIMKKFSDEIIWSAVNSYLHYKKIPINGIYVYAWANDPESLQPQGSINASKINNFTGTYVIDPIFTDNNRVEIISIVKSFNLYRYVLSQFGKGWMTKK